MTAPPDTTLDSDEAASRLRGERPADPSQELDAQLHLAELRQRFAGAPPEAVVFRKWAVESKIGRGGMGTVYLALDRALGRRVALKVLARSGLRGDHVREACALAASPDKNVVQVHSVDDSDPSMVIIEMEYVEGVTLRAWQAERPRHWSAIVEAYAAAGSGLAAIHRAGLVHRDVKPDNILVSTTGDVKVADLGLAVVPRIRPDEQAQPTSRSSLSAALTVRVTHEGALVGTLGYIAPEVLAGVDATAHSDQFSFASALFEALFGGLPFQGLTPEAQAAALRAGALALPDGHDAPSWLIGILKQALAFDPSRRHASMQDLVKALRHGLRRRRRWALLAVMISSLSAVSAIVWSIKPPPPDPCMDAGEPMRAIWPANQRDAFINLSVTNPDPRLRRATEVLIDTLDRRANAWIDTRTRLCSAEHREPSFDTIAHELNLRQRACLDQTRRDIDLLTTALAPAPGLSEQLLEAAAAIEALPSCEDRRAIAHWPLEAAGDSEFGAQLARSVVLEIAGDYPAAEQLARELASNPAVLPFHRAQARYRLGHILGHQHQSAAAFAALDDARNAALISGHEALACQAATYQAKLAANVDLDPQASARALTFAEACATRANIDTPLLKAELLEARGLLAQAAGELEQARDWHRQALDFRRQLFGDAHPDVGKSHHNLANTLADLDPDDPDLLRHYGVALELRERLLGPDHTEVADILLDRSELLGAQAARADLHRALGIYDRAPGAHQAVRANIHLALAHHDLHTDTSAATAHLERARELQAAASDLPPHHLDRARLNHLEGALALHRQDFSLARARLSHALALYRYRAPESAEALAALPLWIEAVAGQGDYLAVAIEARDAGELLRTYLRSLPPIEAGKIAWYVAEAFQRDHAAPEAAAYLRLALEGYEGEPAQAAELRWTLARTLVDAHADLAEARLLADTALQFYRANRRSEAATISRWLAAMSNNTPPLKKNP